jgi:Zn-dependent protease with chaperone function
MTTELQLVAILTTIPVIIWALWCDYFERYLDVLKEHDPQFDRAEELSTVRFAGFFVFSAQLVLYLACIQLRQNHYWTSLAMFLAAVTTVHVFQSKLEKKLALPGDPSLAMPKNPNLFFRTVLWAGLGMGAYLGVLFVANGATLVICRGMNASPTVTLAMILIANIVGVVAGLLATFAIMPWVIQKTMPCESLRDKSTKRLLEQCFAVADVPMPRVFMAEFGSVRTANAMIAGFRAFGFEPSLFLTKALVEQCTAEELRAVVLHEVSHIKLSHLRKRLQYTLMAILGSVGVSVVVLTAAFIFLPTPVVRLIGPFLPLGLLFAAVGQLKTRVQRQEFEADLHAVVHLGANAEALISALEKLDVINGERAGASGKGGHPATFERILILKTYVQAQSEKKAA